MFQRIHGPFGPDPRKIHQGLRRFITARKESTASVAHLGIGPLGSSVKLPGARLVLMVPSTHQGYWENMDQSQKFILCLVGLPGVSKFENV